MSVGLTGEDTENAGTLRRYGTGPGRYIEALSERLRIHDNNLADRYWSRHNVEDLLAERTRFFDDLLTEIWQKFIPEQAQRQLCLFAVGGYGRGEQFPHSDVDLLIRTGGEQRVSNFLLWQIAYAEIVTTECMWPEFRRAHLEDAIAAFQARERRFGLTSAQVRTS